LASTEERNLHLEVVSQIPGNREFAELTLEWIAGARDLVFPGFDAALKDGLVPFDPPDPPGGRWMLRPPVALSARIYIQQHPDLRLGRRSKYTPRSWQRLADGLADAYPYAVSVLVGGVDELGENAGHGTSVRFTVRRQSAAPDVVRFEADIGAEFAPWRGLAGVQLDRASFIRDWTARVGACYGHVTDDANSWGTALEHKTGQPSWETVPRCRDALRGYSWVTVCPGELAGRLGGAGAIAASGAFTEVTEVAGGSVFLRATPTLDEYGDTAVRRVFEVLAPVLLPGRVEAPLPGEWIGRIVTGVDAADYQKDRD
jgi:hypothetical protein